MIHRYAASTLGPSSSDSLASALSRRWRLVGTRYAVALFAVVLFKVLGMLTVTQQLKPAFVTLHLLFGMTTLGLLWWLWLPVNSTSDRDSRAKRFAYLLTLVGLFALGVQIALGGWTSSNYAAAACPDFPTCQGAWWPQRTIRMRSFCIMIFRSTTRRHPRQCHAHRDSSDSSHWGRRDHTFAGCRCGFVISRRLSSRAPTAAVLAAPSAACHRHLDGSSIPCASRQRIRWVPLCCC
jgi:heme A synthase